MVLPIMRLKARREKDIIRGHPWIFSGAIQAPLPQVPRGGLVDVYAIDNSFLGRGYYNAETDIAIRILTMNQDEPIDLDFFKKRIRGAMKLRESLERHQQTNAYRLIHSEGDLLPGFIADKYADYLSVQFSTAGADALQGLFIEALVAEMQPKGIFARNDIFGRTREGLEREFPHALWGETPDFVDIQEHGATIRVDIQKGQKTGFFLDQRDKRGLIGQLAQGKSVLNMFSYTGGFGVMAALNHARKITSVDQSGPAIAMAKDIMELNGFDPQHSQFIVGDAFTEMDRMIAGGEKFDIVILDPPAFAKSMKDKPQALRAYKKLNKLGLDLTAENGVLLTCSCSGPITLEEFRETVIDAGVKANKTPLRIFQEMEHGIDHPVLLAMPESRYLKALFCAV